MVDKNFLKNLEFQITGACIEVHKALGPGLLESIYQQCLEKELNLAKINFVTEKVIAVAYKGICLNTCLRADLYIEDCIVLEIKSVEKLLPVHSAQCLTYMKLLNAPKGLLINFNCQNIIKEGKVSFVNELYASLT